MVGTLYGVGFPPHVAPSYYFTGHGGNGDPKLGASTPTLPSTSTPQPIGGLALDPPSDSGSAFDAWWLAAIAGIAVVALSGVALFTRRVR
jgi:hypothetical protein